MFISGSAVGQLVGCSEQPTVRLHPEHYYENEWGVAFMQSLSSLYNAAAAHKSVYRCT